MLTLSRRVSGSVAVPWTSFRFDPSGRVRRSNYLFSGRARKQQPSCQQTAATCWRGRCGAPLSLQCIFFWLTLFRPCFRPCGFPFVWGPNFETRLYGVISHVVSLIPPSLFRPHRQPKALAAAYFTDSTSTRQLAPARTLGGARRGALASGVSMRPAPSAPTVAFREDMWHSF